MERASRSILFKSKRLASSLVACALSLAFATGCGVDISGPPPGSVAGRSGVYDYSPTAIQVGHVIQLWWCGQGLNPNDPSQNTDTIQYESIDLSTNLTSLPVTVLGETPGAWDSAFTCNPKVIRGSFVNPLGDGQTYTYALYYVATTSPAGISNNIGVAFSKDGIHFNKYPQPVILSTTQVYYGVATPSLYNSDGKSGIWLFYEDINGPPINRHYYTTSTDGIHFTVKGLLTTNGLNENTPSPGWGDMAYDSSIGYWYATFNPVPRNPSTTGNAVERGSPGFTLYRIPAASLLTGAVPWQELKTYDTNVLGNEAVFLGAFLRDGNGNLNIGLYPTLRMFASISDPKPPWNASPGEAGASADPQYWDVGEVEWVPNHPLLALNRYFNKTVHEVTTGWIDPSGGFTLQSTLGHLYEGPEQGATVAFYGCKNGATDYFVSTDFACAGDLALGLDGYAYPQPVAGLTLTAVYSCSSGHDHFVSKDPMCEGDTVVSRLGYLLP